MKKFLYGTQMVIILSVFFIVHIYVGLDWRTTIEAVIAIFLFSSLIILALDIIIWEINRIFFEFNKVKK